MWPVPDRVGDCSPAGLDNPFCHCRGIACASLAIASITSRRLLIGRRYIVASACSRRRACCASTAARRCPAIARRPVLVHSRSRSDGIAVQLLGAGISVRLAVLQRGIVYFDDHVTNYLAVSTARRSSTGTWAGGLTLTSVSMTASASPSSRLPAPDVRSRSAIRTATAGCCRRSQRGCPAGSTQPKRHSHRRADLANALRCVGCDRRGWSLATFQW